MIDETTLERCFRPLMDAHGIALAVSGGADSLALMLLALRWNALTGGGRRLVVLTVDHGLRAESAAEAAHVMRVAGECGLEARSSRWLGPYPEADIEAAARMARYSLLAEAMAEAGLTHLATAHHRDDQAETVLMRLARGSGIYGLAGIARQSERGGIQIVRPLLELGRADLAAVVAAAGLRPIQDPHNRDPRFARARMRGLMPLLAHEGLTAGRLVATAAHLRRAASAIDHYVDRLLADVAVIDAFGAIRFDGVAWQAEHEEVRLRALARVLRAAGGAEHVPRFARLAALERRLVADGAPLRGTLAGAVVTRRDGVVCIEREVGRGGFEHRPVAAGFDGVWDNRFRTRIARGATGWTLGPLGEAGRMALPAALRTRAARRATMTPALWSDGHLLAAPLVGYQGADVDFAAESIVARRLGEAVSALPS